ncbi:hypothetical protein PIB30_047558 [Stylosanthes scabra]|uniref:Uncharacterized protein n=1 Tax=Stylosanthes scabra TaxID=79078 RepID=A0ABU6UJJ2_9FABA|nr:hypothetical protein [Stylosanthes scabra]
MSGEGRFLAFGHHTGKIKKNSRVGIRFSSTASISVFMRSSTTVAELQNTIMQKIGVADSKRVAKLFYGVPIAVVSEHVKYGSFVVQSDTDLEVIFYCRRDFPEVRTTELYAKLKNVVANFGGSNPNPTSNRKGGSSSSALVAPVIPVIPPCVLVATVYRSFHLVLHPRRLLLTCIMKTLVAAVANSLRTVPRGARISEPKGIEEALGDDEDDEEPEYIAGDSDHDHHNIPVGRSVPSSSGSREYPTHFSTLDLEARVPSQEENNAGVGFGGGGSVDVLTPNEFQIGQVFQTKEDLILSVKSYSIRRGG